MFAKVELTTAANTPTQTAMSGRRRMEASFITEGVVGLSVRNMERKVKFLISVYYKMIHKVKEVTA